MDTKNEKLFKCTFSFRNAFGWIEYNHLIVSAGSITGARSKYFQICIDLGLKFSDIGEAMITELA